MGRTGSVAVVLVAVAAAAGAAGAAERIDTSLLRRHLAVLGSDALEGRAPGTRGGRLAATYLADRLEELGLEPLGDDGYLQPVPIQTTIPLPESSLRLSGPGGDRELRLGEDYLLFSGGAQSWIPRPVPTVFAGYGIVAPEFDHDDYADVDVRGRVVVVLGGEPPSDDPGWFAGTERTVYASAEAKQRIAISRGAVGTLIVPLEAGADPTRWPLLQREFGFPARELAYSVPHHLAALVHPRLLPELLAGSGLTAAGLEHPRRRAGIASTALAADVSFHGAFRVRHDLAPNVVGRLPGRDARVRDEHVVVVAHYDGLGRGPAVAGDDIYNGVLDNAIGVAGVLELARVLAGEAERPRRPLIVLFTTGEESGLLGASYFLDHPPVALSRMVAAINVDGLAVRGPVERVISAGGDLSDLGTVLEDVTQALEVEVGTVPEPFSAAESFARSDQLAFARAGIPAMLIAKGFRSGPEGEIDLRRALVWMSSVYHTPSDDLDQPIDLAATADHLEVVIATVAAVADRLRPPRWHPGVRYAYDRLLSNARGR